MPQWMCKPQQAWSAPIRGSSHHNASLFLPLQPGFTATSYRHSASAHQWPCAVSPRRIAAFYHDGLDLPRAGAAEGRGPVIFRGGETCHALLERRKLDHDVALKLLRPLHNLIAPATRQHLATVFCNDLRNQVGVFLVFNGIIDL